MSGFGNKNMLKDTALFFLVGFVVVGGGIGLFIWLLRIS